MTTYASFVTLSAEEQAALRTALHLQDERMPVAKDPPSSQRNDERRALLAQLQELEEKMAQRAGADISLMVERPNLVNAALKQRVVELGGDPDRLGRIPMVRDGTADPGDAAREIATLEHISSSLWSNHRMASAYIPASRPRAGR